MPELSPPARAEKELRPGRPGRCRPGTPQTRTSPIRAYGSSSQGLRRRAIDRVDHLGLRQGMSSEQVEETVPGQVALAGSSVEPVTPARTDSPIEALQAGAIARQAVVLVVTPQLQLQGLRLIRHRPVEIPATPGTDGLQPARQPPLGRLASDHWLCVGRLPPIMQEAQKLKRLCPPGGSRSPKVDQSRLVRMDGQPKAFKPLGNSGTPLSPFCTTALRDRAKGRKR